MTGHTKMSLNEGRTKRVKSTATGTETIYRLVNRDKTKIGVISHIPNCGYSDEELKNLAKRGWKIKTEVRNL
jgi:hypothetical protein